MLHWLNTEIWGPMWPNMFAPSAITLAAIAITHMKAKWHRDRLHAERTAQADEHHRALLKQADAHQAALVRQASEQHMQVLDRVDVHGAATRAAVEKAAASPARRGGAR
jgi:hypothetical protein